MIADTVFSHDARCLSPMKREYLPSLKDWRNSQTDILRQEKALTGRDQEEWFERITHDRRQAIFAITEQKSGEGGALIGYCGITNIDPEKHSGEISFLVNPDRVNDKELYEKDFIAALYMLCRYGFEHLGLKRLFTETYVFRAHHIGILERFGLRRQGLLKKRKFIDGKPTDSVIHSVSRADWPKIKKGIDDELER